MAVVETMIAYSCISATCGQALDRAEGGRVYGTVHILEFSTGPYQSCPKDSRRIHWIVGARLVIEQSSNNWKSIGKLAPHTEWDK